MKTSAIAILGLLSTFITPNVTAAQACDQTKSRPAIERVRNLQSSLLAFKLRDAMDEEVPKPLQKEIRDFKMALAVYADQFVACAPAGVNSRSIESDMARQLDANKPVPSREVYDASKPPQLDRIYGDALNVRVSAPTNLGHLLLIDFSFGIACGGDSLLIAYEQRKGLWQRALQWQSPDYDSVDQAFGDFFQYVALPHNSTKYGWLLAVAHGHPWCTSRWSGFDLDLLQRSTDPSTPNLLEHLNKGYVRFEIAPVMKVVSGGFELRLETGMIDPDIMTKLGIYRYRVIGTKLERVQPVAKNGRDFVDEWLQSPWSDAVKWSASSSLASLERVHAEIHEDARSASGNTAHTFGPTRTCSDSMDHFQVELDEGSYDGKGKFEPGEPTYFQIRQGHNSFTMLSALPLSDRRCTGPDIMSANN